MKNWTTWPVRYLLAVTLAGGFGTSTASTSEAASDPTPLACPGGSLTLQSGVFVINEPCALTGDITLQGTATLILHQTAVVVDGNIALAGDAALLVRESVLTIANNFVLEHHIEARDRAILEFHGSLLVTNAGTVTTSLATQYRGYDDSRLRVEGSKIVMPKSWLLADLYGRAVLHTTNSTNLPSEIYPHDSSTTRIEGSKSDHRIWLEFLPGSKASVENIPSPSAPFTFAFGRSTPGTVNVGYQIDVVNGIATFGIASHPRSDVTVKDNAGAIAIGYSFANVDTSEKFESVGPLLRDATFTHQGRTLRLVNALLEGFAWQIYGANPDVASPGTVRIADSIINELGAVAAARFTVEKSVIQFAVVAALGQDSSIEISRSTVNAQSIVAEKNGVVRIEDSEIFGALVQARDDARIHLLNTRLARNVCHARCLPMCPPHANGGCNPFNEVNGDTHLTADGRASIVVANVDPIVNPIMIGNVYAFTGDVLVQRPMDSPVTYTYDLSYRQAAGGPLIPIVRSGQGPLRSATLGTLDSSNLTAGDYVIQLQVSTGGVSVATVERPFTAQ